MSANTGQNWVCNIRLGCSVKLPICMHISLVQNYHLSVVVSVVFSYDIYQIIE